MKKYSVKMIIGTVVAAIALLCIGAGLDIRERTAWEYKTASTSGQMSDVELNRLGSEGWELTGFTFAPRDTNRSEQSRYIFKRLR